ncbi:MAG: ImuA family protein [Pseudomonadota bacterium]
MADGVATMERPILEILADRPERSERPMLAGPPERPPATADAAARLATLKAAIGGFGPGAATARVKLGLPALDEALGGGLPRGALHEIAAVDGSAAATGFAAFLLGRLAAAARRPVLWMPGTDIYAPGLARYGLEPSRLLLADFRRPQALLRALEEGLRCPGLAAVLGETEEVDLTASRRLQLAAETHGVACLLLRRSAARTASAAVTRWQVWSASTHGTKPRWRVSLLRCRSGRTGDWLLEGCRETGGLVVAAALGDRPAQDRVAAR